MLKQQDKDKGTDTDKIKNKKRATTQEDTSLGKTPEQMELLQNEMTTMMLRSIGEEFNRPIGLIMNNCEYLQSHLAREKANYDPERVTQALGDINTTTIHLNRLVENFIEMTAGMNNVLNPATQLVDLSAMLGDICADSAEIYQSIGISLQVDVSAAPRALVVADRTFAERICLNLLSNALRACTEGEQVCFALAENEAGYVLTVTDDGYGFPPENILLAFSPFQGRTGARAKGFERGSGMGLYLCGESCRLMGWKISISLKDPGTCVRIEIPRNEQVHMQGVCFYSSEYEAEIQAQSTRMEVLRELRTVAGLEALRR